MRIISQGILPSDRIIINGLQKAKPGIKDIFAIPGYSVMDSSTASNSGVVWTIFEDWDQRLPKGLTLEAMLKQIRGVIGPIQEARAFAFPPPAIRGLDRTGGFSMQIQNKNNLGLDRLQAETYNLMEAANNHPGLSRVFSTFRANVPQLKAEIDREQVKSLRVLLP